MACAAFQFGGQDLGAPKEAAQKACQTCRGARKHLESLQGLTAEITGDDDGIEGARLRLNALHGAES